MKYSLGLDIGTTSVGWAVANEDIKRIEDCGVRIFETPENPQNGESLAKPRRDARSARRRNHRRRQRLNYLKNFFINERLLTSEQIKNLLDPAAEPKINPYTARAKGIEKKLSNEELFVALHHIAKRRGYKSNRKKVEEKGEESGQVLKAISENQQFLKKYKTVGAVLNSNEEKFTSHKRNKADSYANSFIREDFEAEAKKILETQDWTEEKINWLFHDPSGNYGGIFDQRTFMDEKKFNQLCGKCAFEQDELRAPKATYSFELFRLAENLSHLKYCNGSSLTPDQIQKIIDLAKQQKSGITYKKVKEIILNGVKDPNFRFDYVRGKDDEPYEDKEKKNKLPELKFYHDAKSCLSETEFSALETDISKFDRLGYVLTANKEDKILAEKLTDFSFSEESDEKLMALSYSGTSHLSLKALRKLTPHLLNGKTYDQAVEIEYPGEFTAKLSGNKTLLPPLSESELAQLTNPVVKRAISQSRKVINAIIKKYGSPYQIKIECTNQLAKSFDERRKIKKQQDENAEHNKERIEKLKELGIPESKITGQLIVKYHLYEEQNCKCQYCGKALGPEIFFDEKFTEIDHIIPFSRCGNDGLANKALVCAECNQEKKNLTPFEKWGSDKKRWQIISDLARGTNITYKKRDRILSEKLPKEDWSTHALNDTRYVMKFVAQYIRKNLEFDQDCQAKQRVALPTGFITSYLRKMYHLGQKDRELNNCHHAVDACVIATVSQSQIQKFALWNKNKELGVREPVDLLPWENFDKEVLIRCGMTGDQTKIEDLQTFRDKFRNFKTYDEEFLNEIHPLIVSRLPKRSVKGSAHKDTIRSPKITDDKRRLTRKRLSECTLKDIENSILPESDKTLYEQLINLIAEKGSDAFKEPIYKNNKQFDKNGRPLSPVSTIKVYSTEPSGILINHGTQFVNNGGTICLNIYRRKGHDGNYKYFAAPVYVHSLNSKKVEILPTPNGRSKEEKTDYESIKENNKIYATPENNFEKLFSIFPNDYVKITQPGKTIEGYYTKYGISNGVISLSRHNSPSKSDTDLLHPTLGPALNVEIINISILGDNYPWRGEP